MAATYYPLGIRHVVDFSTATLRPVMRIGYMASFFVRAVCSVPVVLRHYRAELARLVKNVTWGNGSIVVGGGTGAVIIVLGATAGALIGIEGYNALNLMGLGPATGVDAGTARANVVASIGGFATGRFTTPEEVATLVVLLASERTANVTGANYVIDGGLIKTT